MRVYTDLVILKVEKLEKFKNASKYNSADCSISYCTKRVSKLHYIVNDNKRIIF